MVIALLVSDYLMSLLVLLPGSHCIACIRLPDESISPAFQVVIALLVSDYLMSLLVQIPGGHCIASIRLPDESISPASR